MRVVPIALFTLASISTATATTMRALSIEDLSRQSDLVAVVTPKGQGAAWQGTRIVTTVELLVVDVWAGPAPKTSTIALHLPGGRVGDLGQQVAGTPRLKQGSTYVAFLRKTADGFATIGLGQGVLSLNFDNEWQVSPLAHGGHLMGDADAPPTSVTTLRQRVEAARAP